MSVRACIVAYRSGESAAEACRSAHGAGAEVVLVNNSPGDGTIESVGEACPGATAIDAPRNLGFAAACNLAAEGAEADYLLFLNPDAVLTTGALDTLTAFLDDHPEAAVAAPALVFPDGKPQPSVRRDPTAFAILHQYTIWRYTFLFARAYRAYRAAAPGPDGQAEVLMGSALLVRRSAFEEIGGFDERYFMYYEEADLCRKLREAGGKNYLVGSAQASHVGGLSEDRASVRLAATRLVSAQRYLRRFLSPGRYALFRIAFLTGFPIRAMTDLLRDLLYAVLYAVIPGRRRKAAKKAKETLAAASLLTADLFRVVAA